MKRNGVHVKLQKGIRLYLLIYLVYISLGIPDSILGVAWPSVQLEFDVPLAAGSMLVAIVSVLAASSSLMYGFYETRLRPGIIIFFSCMLTALGLFFVGLSSTFVLLCLAVIPMGIGAGAVDTAINNYVSVNMAPKHMIWLHGFWGVGAVVGPTIYSLFLNNSISWHQSALIIGVVQSAICLVLLLNQSVWGRGRTQTIREDIVMNPTMKRGTLDKSDALLRVLFVFVFSGLDISVSLWFSSFFVHTGRASIDTAGFIMAAYYAAVTGGRFIIGLFTNRIPVSRLIAAGICLATVGLVLTFSPIHMVGTFIGIVILGIGLAPIHPFTLYETHMVFTEDYAGRIMSFQIAASLLGSLILPAIIGILAEIGMTYLIIAQLILLAVVIVLRILICRKCAEAKKRPYF